MNFLIKFSRAMHAVELLTRIRNEAPELWKQIQEFARAEKVRRLA